VVDELNCSDGFIINTTCYVVYKNEKVHWFTAVNRCLSLNGSLAVFDDNVRSYINITLIPGETDDKDSSWIGLVKPWWTWSSMFHISYLCWQTSEFRLLRGQLWCFYRTMHYSAKHGLAIACRLSICPSVALVNQEPKGHPPNPREHGEILGRLQVGLEKVAC